MMVLGSVTLMAFVVLTFGKFIWADGYKGLDAVLVSDFYLLTIYY